MQRKSVGWLLVMALCGCNSEIRIGDPLPTEQELEFDFETGQQGWQADFSDYPRADAANFNLQSGVRAIPDAQGAQGFYLAGSNLSDDLFMYLKSRFTGLEPNTRYRAFIEAQIVSNAGAGCAGIGGSPGESVYVKVGYAQEEPVQVDYYLNVDKGNQSQGGSNANVVGNVAIDGLDCSGTALGRKTVLTSSSTELEFTTTSEGRIWLFIGTDSGFEGRTEIYYDSLLVRVRPR